MILRLFPSLGLLVGASGGAARGLLLRGALMSAAGLIGIAGTGFVIFAGFAALRLVLGTEISALVVGAALLALAGVLVRFSLVAGQKAQVKKPLDLPPLKPSPVPLPPTQPTTLAIFTAAFVLGRRLADQRRD